MDLLFGEKCIIFVLAKRRMPIDKGFSPLFLPHYKGRNTSDVEKFIRQIGFFFSESGFFLGEVGARIDDVDMR